MPPMADLEDWLSFGRHDPHHRTNGVQPGATGRP
jgi:hypothetical protein